MAFIQILLFVNFISSAWGHAVYIDCNGKKNAFEGSGCGGCNSEPIGTVELVMGAAPVDDASIITASVKETKPSTDVTLTFELAGKAGIQASGGSFSPSSGTAGTVVTEGCDGDNALINWGGTGAAVSGSSVITWTAPSTPGFEVTFWAFNAPTYGAIKRTTWKISDSDGVATKAPDVEKSVMETEAPGADTEAPGSDAPGDDSGAVRVEIPMAFMITLFIGLLKF